MTSMETTDQLAAAQAAHEGGDSESAVRMLHALIDGEAEDPKVQEAAVYAVATIYVEKHRGEDLRALLVNIRPFFQGLPKARTAKIVRSLIDLVAKIPESDELQIELCLECIHWCTDEKRTFLRHRVESRLAQLYHHQGQYNKAVAILTALLLEVKKLDDKLLLVEIHLLESQHYFVIRNLAKSKAALTASRSNANAIHCPPMLQAEIDVQAGVLHAAEKDFKTSFSYFYEAFEAYNVAAETTKAVQALKYMLLAKIMCNQSAEVISVVSGKYGVKYGGRPLDALKRVARSYQQRSLAMFEATLNEYTQELSDDQIIKGHISDLYDTLLEQNLLRILEPFNRVEIDHVAQLVKLPLSQVQSKLSQMVLDGKLAGTLDQGVGVLILYDEPPLSDMYSDVLSTFKNMSQVVDSLYKKAQKVA